MFVNICRAVAIFGGFLLLVITAIVVVSVSGRALVPLGLAPIPGDFELVEISTALAVFCFLPWCQLKGGHVTVDVLSAVLGRRIEAWLSMIYNICMTGIAVLIAWRLWDGMIDMQTYSETTFILQIPVWWAYAGCLPLALLFVLVSAWTVLRDLREALAAGQDASAEAGR